MFKKIILSISIFIIGIGSGFLYNSLTAEPEEVDIEEFYEKGFIEQLTAYTEAKIVSIESDGLSVAMNNNEHFFPLMEDVAIDKSLEEEVVDLMFEYDFSKEEFYIDRAMTIN